MKAKLEKMESTYRTEITSASEYDYMEVIVSGTVPNHMKVSMLDGRWRTKEETIALFKEAIKILEAFNPEL